MLGSRARKELAELAGHAVQIVVKHRKNKTIRVYGYVSPDEATTRGKAVALADSRAKTAAAIVRRVARGRATVAIVPKGFPIPLAIWPSKYEHRFRSVLLGFDHPVFLAYDVFPKMAPSRVKALQRRAHHRHQILLKSKGILIDGVGLHFPIRHLTVFTPKGPIELCLRSTRYDPDEKHLHRFFSRWLARCRTREKPGM